MAKERIDPIFNNPVADKKAVTANTEAPRLLVAATENPPLSPTSKQPMTLVKGAYGNREFSMWVDLANRLCVPVRENVVG